MLHIYKINESNLGESMRPTDEGKVKEILDWCTSVVGPCEVVSGDTRFHGRAMVCRLQTSSDHYYVKIHRQKHWWEKEVHGYEQWAPAFGGFAPELLAVHEEDPLALIVSELPGRIMEEVQLPLQQELMAWHAAGSALAAFHDSAVGESFGHCGRDGVCIGTPIRDAREYISSELQLGIDVGAHAGYFSDDELAVIRAAQELVPAFADERPVPCHRDYCPLNWLVTDDGIWAGVIDFEFAYWDVRVADFSRYPDWEWMRRPDLLEAFFDGYGRPLTPKEEQQRLVSYTQYALSMVIWGCENSLNDSAEEAGHCMGRQALKHLAGLLG